MVICHLISFVGQHYQHKLSSTTLFFLFTRIAYTYLHSVGPYRWMPYSPFYPLFFNPAPEHSVRIP
jgi:hypothetical protein